MMNSMNAIHGAREGGDGTHIRVAHQIYSALILEHKRMKLIFMMVDCCRRNEVAANAFFVPAPVPMCFRIRSPRDTHTHTHACVWPQPHTAYDEIP